MPASDGKSTAGRLSKMVSRFTEQNVNEREIATRKFAETLDPDKVDPRELVISYREHNFRDDAYAEKLRIAFPRQAELFDQNEKLSKSLIAAQQTARVNELTARKAEAKLEAYATVLDTVIDLLAPETRTTMRLIEARAAFDNTFANGEASPALKQLRADLGSPRVLRLMQAIRDKTGNDCLFLPAPARPRQEGMSYNANYDAALPVVQEVVTALTDYVQALGPNIELKPTVKYLAFAKDGHNFGSVRVVPSCAIMYLTLDPRTVQMVEGFTRSMLLNDEDVERHGRRYWGRHGTGYVEVRLLSMADLETAQPLIDRAYSERIWSITELED